VLYQVYPRSFADSDGDGVGDLAGITGRLEYLRDVGVDAVWLSPIYPSPMADFGYDISDYERVHPLFGTLEDFDALVGEAHGLGLKVILDFVPNHTSDEHPWFLESRSSRENARRDWYIWRDAGTGGGPPNNWRSLFGGSAWEWDEETGQYYLHLFHRKQPDLNWRNPEVRKAMLGVMRFWFERGVDGFRIDVLAALIKDDQMRDNPPNPDWREGDPPYHSQQMLYTEDRPEMRELVREMRVVANDYEGRVLIGEIYLSLERLVAYYGEGLSGIHLPFNFGLVLLEEWAAAAVRRLVEEYEAALPDGAWPNWVLGNHDNPRISGRVGPSRARVAQMLLLTLRGTPTCYYGDEIGMQDVRVPPHLIVDPVGKSSPGHSRDPERTPMQWDASPNAGFSSGEPWLPVADDHAEVNVAAQQKDPHSHLALFKRLTGLRRQTEALSTGSYRSLDAGDEAVFAYLRESGEERVLVALNFRPVPTEVNLSAAGNAGDLLCSTLMDWEGQVDPTRLALRPDEGVVVRLPG
jgi:alpha-glucosidase